MQNSSLTLPVDLTLTPENAQERGYRWVDDLAYDESIADSADLLRDIQRLLADGYKLGRAQYPISGVDKGVYEPLEK